MAEEHSFLGRGWGFPVRFDDINMDNSMVTREEDIYESLRILLGTQPGERTMQPRFGCNLRQFVHEVADESLFTHIKEVIRDAILRFEARIDVEHIDTEYDVNEGVLHITLDYRIRQTNSRHNLVYPFYLLEGNNTGIITS